MISFYAGGPFLATVPTNDDASGEVFKNYWIYTWKKKEAEPEAEPEAELGNSFEALAYSPMNMNRIARGDFYKNIGKELIRVLKF